MKKIRKVLAGILLGCMVLGTVVLADSAAAILEIYTGESQLSIYVRGVDADAGEINVQIATTQVSDVSAQSVSELSVPMQTLVMVDNSLSVPVEDRTKVSEFMQNLIADRLEREEICIATFSESVQKLTEYTSDYATLKKAADGITYQDQETYLTDVLYDLLYKEYIQNPEDVFRRIIVISDGVDNKSLGYTKDELYALLKENRIPIYTIGCVNGKNNEELENMFALSRATSGSYFLLDEEDDVLNITNTLHQDREIVKLTVAPSADLLDGSRKNVKIMLPDGTTLTDEAVMPQQVYTEEEPKTDETANEEVPENEPEEVYQEENAGVDPIIWIAGIVAVILIVAGVIVVAVIRKKNHNVNFEPIDDTILKELEQNTGVPEEKTEMVHFFTDQEEDESTVMIWDRNVSYQIVLTDINTPIRSFQTPLVRSVIVGRKQGNCDIVLDYEKSVSNRHCEISVRDGRFYVKDLQSSNGTYLNGSKVLMESEIFSGNILKLGRLEMRFEVR